VSPHARRAIRDGLIVAGLLFAGYLFLVIAPQAGTLGFDAYAYWSVDPADPYAQPAGELGAFPYTPVAVWFFAPLGALLWPTFLTLWLAFLVGTVIWLGWRASLAVLAFPPVALELYHGNVHLLIAAAIALGFRYPGFWAVPLLTKVTPGVGLVWFAVRREWRRLGWALGVTAVLVAITLVLDAGLWAEWWDSVVATGTGEAPVVQPQIPIPLWLRLPAALLLVAWGARTDRAWTVPAAATLAVPILWPSALAILAALWPIAQLRPDLTDDATLSPGSAARG
jgi:hypothetical protein